MLGNLRNLLDREGRFKRDILKGNFGLEKENVRVDREGHLALTPHPKELGDKSTHPYITTDFSESQIEMITPPFKNLDETYYFMENIHDIVSGSIGEELLWPQSIPPALPEEEHIPIARYDGSRKGIEAEEYREMLAEKYGKKKQLISGIHYNFSFEDEFLKRVQTQMGDTREFKEFKSDIYLKMARNLLRYNWLLIYIFGASIGSHESYSQKCNSYMKAAGEGTYYFPHATSFRNGPCGYKNLKEYMVSYNTISEYTADLRKLIEVGEISGAKEYYSSVRVKTLGEGDILDNLDKNGVSYLELRFVDLNPFKKIGIERETLYFLHLFLIYCLVADDRRYTEEAKREDEYNTTLVSSAGRMENTLLIRDGEKVGIKQWKREIFTQVRELLETLSPKDKIYEEALNRVEIRAMEDPLSKKLVDRLEDEGYINFHLNRAKKYLEETQAKEYNLKSYEDLELSTQILIKEALKRGVRVDILDRKENFIALHKGDKTEYVKQATKTSLDSYSTVLVMENKLVTKRVLDENKVRTPQGRSYTDVGESLDDFELYSGGGIVIKPNNTNFGIGITIFKDGIDKESYKKAVEIAFSHDSTILIEEFISGKEYRFFVIGDEVVGILHRVPANVCGDGKRSISDLVHEKNKDPLRGKGYRTPLEKINLGVAEEMFLKGQNLDFDYIPGEGEVIYLRENSNISTGGDSIDFTDEIHPEYKRIAVEAAKAVDATICGVDMMLDQMEEFDEGGYGIIELNFNPAIHIHCYPYSGKNRELGKKVLDKLGF